MLAMKTVSTHDTKTKIWVAPDALNRRTDEEIAKLLYGDSE